MSIHISAAVNLAALLLNPRSLASLYPAPATIAPSTTFINEPPPTPIATSFPDLVNTLPSNAASPDFSTAANFPSNPAPFFICTPPAVTPGTTLPDLIIFFIDLFKAVVATLPIA